MTIPQLKQLGFLVRYELMLKVRDDLVALKHGEVVQPQRSYAEVMGAVRLINSQQESFGLETLAGKHVAVYFSAHWVSVVVMSG